MRDAKSHLTENTQTKDAKCLDRVQTKIWGIQICTMCAKIPIKPYIKTPLYTWAITTSTWCRVN